MKENEHRTYVGAQLYTVRNFARTPDEIYNTFKRCHEIGFECVQVSGIGAIESERLRDISLEFKLPIVCTHVGMDAIINETEKVIKDHKTFLCNKIGIGHMPAKYHGADCEGVKQFIAELAPAIERIEASGLKFLYHNHDFEFVPNEKGGCVFDYMIENCSNWGFILDTYWLRYAERDVIEYAKRLKGRIECVHLKDMEEYPKGKICAIGNGVLEFTDFVKAYKEAGTKYFLVEQDNADTFGDPFEQFDISLKNIRKNGWS